MQSLQLDLSALALGQGEEVVGAQLHDDKRVTQTLEATREVRGTEKPPPPRGSQPCFSTKSHVSSHESSTEHGVDAVRNYYLVIVAKNSRCVRGDAGDDCSSVACS